jgi:putative methionine-R-sulfoxide reductase with GAF domain
VHVGAVWGQAGKSKEESAVPDVTALEAKKAKQSATKAEETS